MFVFIIVWQVRKHVNDLYEDLRDGHNLISLLEVLSGETLVSKLLFKLVNVLRILEVEHLNTSFITFCNLTMFLRGAL